MASSAELSRHRFWRQLVNDLAAFPGRLAMSWRIALICALTAMMAMVYGIPEAAISCYLIFFVMKPDAAESILLAIALTLLIVGVIATLLLLTQWTIQVPALRILAIAVSSMILLYFSSASKLGALGGIIALILAFGLTLLSYVPTGELATRAILYAWLMATMPMLWVVVVCVTIGRKPLPLIRQAVAERLEIAADWLENATPENRARLREQVWEGQEDLMKRWGMMRLFALARRDESRRLGVALQESYRLVFILLALNPNSDPVMRYALAHQARSNARALRAGDPIAEVAALPDGAPHVITQGWAALQAMVGTPDRPLATAPSESFMRADARSNPEHLRYAIKTTAAAITCYLTYTALDWQGIHTAMITCYVAALGSVAETAHKLFLRIVGCLIGAALGIGSILFLIPHMNSVGSLMLMVFVGTFIAAWVAVGSDRVSYAGVQIALAFLLTVLQGFSPSIDMDTARGRIFGVLLGNCVLYLMFTQFWPVSVAQRVWDNTSRALGNLARMARMPRPGQPLEQEHSALLAEAAGLASRLGDTRYSLELTGFEPRYLRLQRNDIQQIVVSQQALRSACLDLLLTPRAEPEYAQRLETLSLQTSNLAAGRDIDAPTEAPIYPAPPDSGPAGNAATASCDTIAASSGTTTPATAALAGSDASRPHDRLPRAVQKLETLIHGR